MENVILNDKKESKTLLAQIREILQEEDNNLAEIESLIKPLPAAEIATILESLPINERDIIWQMVSAFLRGDVLAHLSEDVLNDLVEDMSSEHLKKIAQEMDKDDLADLLQGLDEKVSHNLLGSLDKALREKITKLINYDENSAGGLMNTDGLISLRENTTVKAALKYIRNMKDLPAITNKLFVVDKNGSFLGEVLLTDILTADDEKTIKKLMNSNGIILAPHTSAAEVARSFLVKDLVSAPVVDEEGKLVGRITVDDVMDYIRDEAERRLMQSAGMDEEVDTFAPIPKAAYSRGIWLGINLITALCSAFVISIFGATIEKTVALAALSPIVASMAGNAGLQSLTLVIRGMALGHIEAANAKSLLLRELAISIIEGCIWGIITSGIAYFWFGKVNLALIMMTAIFSNILCGTLFGICIPLLLKKLKIDPALAGSVILTAMTDVVGFMLLLGLATIIL